MTSPPDDRRHPALDAQAEALRAELSSLRRDLAQMQQEIADVRALQLLEANEQLVIAALKADAIAQAAIADLESLTRAGLGDRPPAPPDRPSDRDLLLRNLRDANERLVIGALAAQGADSQADEVHARQIEHLAIVAHELRHPLTPISTAVALLKRCGSDAAQVERLQGIIERQVAQMTRLIEDLLDESRLSTGRFRLRHETVDLIALLRLVIESARSTIAQRRQRLTSALPEGRVLVLGDAARLSQVFDNLLDNASKYTPEGGEISVSLSREDALVTVTVADNGCGIRAEDLPHVFDLFVRASPDPTAKDRGLGIGLAVVRELVESHGGTVVAASAGSGLGSRFVVTLPAQP